MERIVVSILTNGWDYAEVGVKSHNTELTEWGVRPQVRAAFGSEEIYLILHRALEVAEARIQELDAAELEQRSLGCGR